MKIRSIAFLIVFVIACNVSFGQKKQWSINECIEYAWENNLRLKQQQLRVYIAKQSLLQSRGNLFPTLNANASHLYNYGRTVDPLTNEFATERIQSNNFSISSGLTVFSGLQIYNTIKQSKLELEAEEYDVSKMRNDITLSIALAYLQIIYSLEVLETTNNQVEITRQQLERTKKLVDAGTQPRGALFTIEAQLASEELQLINAQNRLNLAYLDLAQMLDIKDVENFEIKSPEVEFVPQKEYEYSPMQIYNVAIGVQPEIKSADIRVKSAEKGLAIARGARSPMLSLRGSYGTGYTENSREIVDIIPGEPTEIGVTAMGEPVFAPTFQYNTQIKPFSDQLNDNLNHSFGFYLTIPIFNNFQVSAAVSRSKINLDNSRISNQLVKDQLFKNIQQAHADASAALRRYSASLKNVEALKESFRYIEQRFNVGMVNYIEYNDAKNRLATAESELLQSKFEYVFRTSILDFYMGNPLRF
ncbi:MAG: TolC family protein [Bacteroidetes bacterium]|nr:TolC family protein [Bacteroidota bacterium]